MNVKTDNQANSAAKWGKGLEIPALTGIRAIAACWVVAYHIRAVFLTGSSSVDRYVQGAFGSGFLGVDLFFCLSGFVIAYNYWDDFIEFRAGRYGHFLWMRLARLYPIHLATLLLSLALYLGARWKGIALHFGASWTAEQFVQNLLLIHNWSFHPVMSWNYPAWSISCEWLAYLSFPFLVRALLNRRSALLLGACGFAGLLALCGMFQIQHGGPVGGGIPRIAANFFAGVVVFRLQRMCTRTEGGERLVMGALAAALAVLVLTLVRPEISPFWMVPAFPVLLYGLACSHGRAARWLSCAPLVFWGRASYSLYMTHGLAIMVLSKIVPLSGSYRGVRHMTAALAVYLTTIGAAAVAAYFLIEEPGRRWMKARCKGWGKSSRPLSEVRVRSIELQHAAN